MKKKLFFFGIDSATWDLIRPWVKQGKLPGFFELLKNGSCFDLASTIPPLTPVAWPTLTTGASPAQHGFYDFYRLDKSKQITINLASELPQPFFWDLLSRAGYKTAVFNIPITFPFKPVNGIMISGLTTPGLKSDFIYPSKLKKEFLKLFPKFRFAPSIKVNPQDPQSYALRLEENIEDAKETISIAKWLFAKDNWDVFVINFMAVDHVQHFFWEFMSKPASVFENAILQVYQQVDNYLLAVLKKHSPNYQIMVLSDHGAGPLEKTLFLNHWLYQKKLLFFKKSPRVWFKRTLAYLGIDPELLIKLGGKLKLIRRIGKVNMQSRNRLLNKLVLSYADLDWDKTKAYSFGMYGGIFLTKKSAQLEAWLIKEMKKDFGKDLTFIDSSEHIYQTKKLPETIPDIQFLLKKGAVVSTNIYAFAGSKLLTKPITSKSGEHRVNGILGFYPALKTRRISPSLMHITPTILDYFDVPLPSYCRAGSLLAKKQYLDINEIEI